MEEIGQKIKEARLEKGIQINEVQRSTKIRSKYLKAIEEGNFEIIPQEVFLKGFLRVYANYVGLDGKEIMDEYNQLKLEQGHEDQEIKEDRKEEGIVSFTKGLLDLIKRIWKPLAIGLIIALMIFIGITVYRSGIAVKVVEVVQNVGKSSLKKEKLVLEDNKTEAKSSSKKENIETKAKISDDIKGNEKSDLKEEKKTVTEKLNITIEVLQESWIKVIADGELVFQKILNPGEKKSWQVDRKFNLLTGNAAGVKVIANGEEFGPFGEQGEVIEKEFKLEND
jgi:cytoskeletal protein RodZ